METCFRFPAGPCQSPYFLEKGFVWGWPQAGKLGLMMGGASPSWKVVPKEFKLKTFSFSSSPAHNLVRKGGDR